MSWLAAAAVVVALIGVAVFQNMSLRRELAIARAPHLVDSFSLLGAGTRGAEELTIANGSRPFAIDFDIPPQQGAERYVVRVVDADGEVFTTAVVNADAARDTQHLLVPGGALHPGKYSLEVHSEPAGPPATAWSFAVR